MPAHEVRRFSENFFMKQIKVIDSVVDGTFPSTYIDVSPYARFAFLIAVGATDDTAVTAQVVQATAAAGTGTKSITGAALTGTLLAGSNDNKWSIIEVDSERLDIANDFQFVAITLGATGGAATTMAVFFIGIEPRVKPPTFGSDLAEQVFVDG
jgi:hypothetical protein